MVFDLNTDVLTWLILSAAPVFAVGLAEDLGYAMSPRSPFNFFSLSSLIAIIFFKVWLFRVGIPGLDSLLVFTPFAVLFTIFATVGVVNAFNLIDGLNGLSSYVSISIAVSISVIAFQVENLQFSVFLALLTSAVLGFLTLNFLLEKYFWVMVELMPLGHLLVWSAILLIDQASEISPFAILLIFFGLSLTLV